MAATMGYDRIAELTHEMENMLSLLKGGQLKVNAAIVDLCFRCVDALEEMVEAVEKGDQRQKDITGLVSRLKETAASGAGDAPAPEALSGPETEAGIQIVLDSYDRTVLEEARAQQFRIYHLVVAVSSSCLMKSVRAFMVFKTLEEMGEIIKSFPPAQEIEEEKFDKSFELILITKQDPEAVLAALEKISEISVASLIDLEPAAAEAAVSVPATEALPAQVAEIVEGQIDAETGTETGAETEAPDTPAQPQRARSHQTVRVDLERLDNVMNLVGELVINKTRLAQISTAHGIADLHETLEQVDRITTDLQAVVMKIRMVPVENVFNRFPRMVRDLSRELGKQINLIIEGKETELDRTVIDEIGDPLVHLIRNSVDHGVEEPAVREKAGKPRAARIKLAARQEGNHVIIEVSDDGRGIDLEKIKDKARKKGLFRDRDGGALDDKTLVDFIFQPGFSTADKVTDVSGRGVGLDVVRTKIEALSGIIDVETKKGEGTRFIIRLPLTLAIIQALLVKVGPETYAIPLSSVDETTNITPGDIKPVQNQDVVLLRGNVLPLVRMREMLEVPDRGQAATDLDVVVVRRGEKQVGLVVDSLIGQQEIVIKSLGRLLTGTPGIAGATILGNGQVSMILDVGTLF
jgi:two-component system chemotaxis sensor kinase CheA